MEKYSQNEYMRDRAMYQGSGDISLRRRQTHGGLAKQGQKLGAIE
jgi:hypothetical protein